MTWKPEIFADGEWVRNGLTFGTQEEAKKYAQDLYCRWTEAKDHRAVEVDSKEFPVNYLYIKGELVSPLTKIETVV
jgi:hypothetical protein